MAQNTSNQLFTEIFRPKTLKDCILLPRIEQELKNGLQGNILFHSNSPGTGKSTLTRILSDGYDVLYLNSSLDNGIDIVRDQILPFTSSVSLFNGEKTMKIVILEEFDNSSRAMQDSIRALMEVTANTTRWIANCNYVDKIIEPLLSRFNVIQVSPIDKQEEEFLFNGYKERAGKILSYLKINYTDETLSTFIENSFPDMRSVIKKIQQLYTRQATELTPDMLSQTFDCSQLFQLITTKPDPWNNYKALVSDWSTKADEAILEIGKNFTDYLHTVAPNQDNKIPQIIITIAEHQNMLASAIDKFIVLESLVFKLQYIIWQ